MEIPTYSDLKGSEHKQPKYIKIHWPEFYNLLQEKYPGDPLNIQLYMYFNNIHEHPHCVCGAPLKYISPTKGFRKFCSIKCSMNDPRTIVKSKQTNKLRYGGTGYASAILKKKAEETNQKLYGAKNAMRSSEIKEKMQKTCMERYGVSCAIANPEIYKKSRETQDKIYGGTGMGCKMIAEKIKKTQIERYGGVGLASEKIREMAFDGSIRKYGAPVASTIPSVIEKIRCSRIESIKKKYPIIDKIYWEAGAKIYECTCPHPNSCNKCDGRFKIYNEQFYRRLSSGIELCTILLPYQHPHHFNTSTEVFIKMILEKHKINFVQNDRDIIAPKEVDFYLPEYNLAIECNGIKWHSILYKEISYHRDKYLLCQSKNIQLLSIWEDWIVNCPKIVESIILHKIGLTQAKIYARNCILQRVEHHEAQQFLIQNHIQGSCNASYHYGLYYNNILVSLMSFGKRRPGMGKGKNYEHELLRFCNLLNTNVIGAAGKLLKHYIQDHNPQVIVSFSSNDISNGHLYECLGFTRTTSNKSYWYIGRDFKRYHRFVFCKSKLVRMGYDANKTEKEIMRNLPYYCIYDSGQQKWELQIKKEP